MEMDRERSSLGHTLCGDEKTNGIQSVHDETVLKERIGK
jgi:hypothetical protein